MTPAVLPTAPGWERRAAALVRAAPPGPAGNRLVTVDGYSGAGKSSRACELADALDAPLLEIEDLCPGWAGLPRVPELARRGIGAPLAAGEPLRWTSWDWERDAPGPVRERAPAALVVLEGCGAGAPALAATTSLGFWVDAPAAVREERLRARPDWPVYRPHRETWRRAEESLAVAGRSRERAGVLLVAP